MNTFAETYQKNFGSFITKFRLGGIVQEEDSSVEAQRLKEIEKSRRHRQSLFTQEKTLRLSERLKALSPEERDKLESV